MYSEFANFLFYLQKNKKLNQLLDRKKFALFLLCFFSLKFTGLIDYHCGWYRIPTRQISLQHHCTTDDTRTSSCTEVRTYARTKENSNFNAFFIQLQRSSVIVIGK